MIFWIDRKKNLKTVFYYSSILIVEWNANSRQTTKNKVWLFSLHKLHSNCFFPVYFDVMDISIQKHIRNNCTVQTKRKNFFSLSESNIGHRQTVIKRSNIIKHGTVKGGVAIEEGGGGIIRCSIKMGGTVHITACDINSSSSKKAFHNLLTRQHMNWEGGLGGGGWVETRHIMRK